MPYTNEMTDGRGAASLGLLSNGRAPNTTPFSQSNGNTNYNQLNQVAITVHETQVSTSPEFRLQSMLKRVDRHCHPCLLV